MVDRQKIGRQPGQQQIKRVVVAEKSEYQSADSSLTQQVPERRSFGGFLLIFRLRTAFCNVLTLRIRKPLVFTRVSIERIEQNEIKDADESRRGETPSPSKMQKQDAKQRDSDGGRKLSHRIKGRRC